MVTHCVCHDVSFEQLKQIAQNRGLDFEGLKACTGACTACGACGPYVELMLRTGRTSLPILDARTRAELMQACPPPAPAVKDDSSAAA